VRDIIATAIPNVNHLNNGAEVIHIFREVAAESTIVMLYSVGKDSSVLLHLARKAFVLVKSFPLFYM